MTITSRFSEHDCDSCSKLLLERDEAREIAYSARRIADKHAARIAELQREHDDALAGRSDTPKHFARVVTERNAALATVLELRAMVERLADARVAMINRDSPYPYTRPAQSDDLVIAARALLERTKP